MADSNTTNYSLTKPEVGASDDTWGTKLNTNLDTIDSKIDDIEGKSGAATLKHTDLTKLVTTATGIDITGDVSTDTLTIDGTTVTATATELNYTDGVTSNIQTQLNGKATTAQGALADSAVQPNDNVSLGTVTADGLTVNGEVTLGSSASTHAVISRSIVPTGSQGLLLSSGVDTPESAGIPTYSDTSSSGSTIQLFGNAADSYGGSVIVTAYGSGANGNTIKFSNRSGVGTTADRVAIASNGDVSFYEDTGTTAKMVWSSSKEQLQITSANSGASGWTENVYLKASQYPSLRFWETTGGKVASIGNNGDGSMVLSVNGTTGAVGTNAMTLDSAGNVGVGTSSPYDSKLHVTGKIRADGGTSGGYFFGSVDFDTGITAPTDGNLAFSTNGTERARIDNSGNLLVGTTDPAVIGNNTKGTVIQGSTGTIFSTAENLYSMILNRKGSDGEIVNFRKDGATVGSIGVKTGTNRYLTIGCPTGTPTGLIFDTATASIGAWNVSTNSGADDTVDLGYASRRFKDLYLSGGVYLGGTGAANKLDDYETGDWTPALGGTWTSNPTGLTGTYVKVGKLVYIKMIMSGGAKANTTSAWLTGLPFNVLVGSTGSVVNSAVTDNENCLLANGDRVWLTETSFSGTTYITATYETNE